MTATTLCFMVFICSLVCSIGWSQNCQDQDTGWEKIIGAKPANSVETVLYKNSAIGNSGIVVPCFERCKSLNCTAFVIDFVSNICYSVQVKGEELIPETNATFFHKICIKVSPNCKRQRLWQVERTLGAILKDGYSNLYFQALLRRSECYEKCLKAGSECESAQFRTSEPLSIEDTLGMCSLSKFERGTRPQAYRSSMYRDEYLQDQCHNISKKNYCSYAEFRNVTLPYSDIALPGLDLKQCEEKCDRSQHGFICRAYTVDYSEEKPFCLLHSDDTISLGVSSLVTRPNVIYKEQEACLDLKVQCGESIMTVVLTTAEPFDGRMYVSGFGDTCGVNGVGNNVTILRIPLPKKEIIGRSNIECGLTPAFSINNENRTHTLVWATIVIQYNPIIQRLGDQSVRIGCSLDGRDIPEPRNVSVNSSFSFLDPNAGVPPVGSIVINASSEAPVVTMRILNEEHMDAVVTQLGQKLTLRIEIRPADGPYDIIAGHLVASSASGDSSYLLLDESGCPTDSTTFPALLKDPMDNRSLISTFTAFKFPDSQIVRFNVIVKFCLEECEPATCRGGQISYGRKRRSIEQPLIAEVTEIFRNLTPAELPLQLSIVVQSPVITADHLLSRENPVPDTVLITGGRSIDGLICVDASLALGLLIFWLIIQIILTAGCLLAVRRYRKMAVEAEEDRADILARHLYGIHGGNFEIARRVRWADRNDSSIG
ncbi:ZP domain-containing protein [Camponotus japonicus]